MFVFEDLLTIDAIQLKEIVARVDRKVLTFALKGTSEQAEGPLLRHHVGRAAPK